MWHLCRIDSHDVCSFSVHVFGEGIVSAKEQAKVAREAEVEEILAEFGGDHRAAISALLSDLDVLARDREASVSHGFTRGVIRLQDRKECARLGRPENDYRVETWDNIGRRTAVLAHCDSLTIADAAYAAAISRYPYEEITLRHGCRLIKSRAAQEAVGR